MVVHERVALANSVDHGLRGQKRPSGSQDDRCPREYLIIARVRHNHAQCSTRLQPHLYRLLPHRSIQLYWFAGTKRHVVLMTVSRGDKVCSRGETCLLRRTSRR